MDFAECMLALRRRLAMTQAAFGQLIGEHRVTVAHREAGDRDLASTRLQQIAAATNCGLLVTPDGWQIVEPPDPLPPNPDRDAPASWGADIPIAGAGSAGHGAVNDDLMVDFFNLGERWLSHVDRLIQIEGASMEPLLRAGDWVGVRLEQPFRRGDLVVAEIGVRGEVVVKRYGGVVDGWLQLESVNAGHSHIIVPADQGRVRGLVWGLWRPPEAVKGA